jgi:hypothetical protein
LLCGSKLDQMVSGTVPSQHMYRDRSELADEVDPGIPGSGSCKALNHAKRHSLMLDCQRKLSTRARLASSMVDVTALQDV